MNSTEELPKLSRYELKLLSDYIHWSKLIVQYQKHLIMNSSSMTHKDIKTTKEEIASINTKLKDISKQFNRLAGNDIQCFL